MAPIALLDGGIGQHRHSDHDLLHGEPRNDQQHTNGTFEPLAVVGLSLKFPEDATSPDAFFQMLLDRRCVMSEWPKDRVNVEAFHNPLNDTVDTIPFRGGHFLKEPLGKFDAPFFTLTSSEANAMDPQQRLLLETAYRALENAGITLEKAFGSNTSVHTGSFGDDYKLNLTKDPMTLPTYTATGVAPSMLAARLSWFFNLTGPCVNLDSACSSSMMAFDLACQGLRNRETDMALVGGANVVLGLDMSLPLSNMNFVSHDSRCFSFDHRANGYGRGEGFGVVVVKRLSDALRNGDTIRAVVRSTGSNQDGHTPGITQPSTDAQLRLIRRTYEKAGLDMGPTRYVEAHGTGTRIGDPVEAGAIGTAFREFRTSSDPLFIGAVKSNVGHLEGASGIAGIIKAILVLESAVIPPNANFERLNPNIDADGLRIAFPQTITPWPTKGLRRVSVMSFGFGGSNSTAVMDDACNFMLLNGLTGNHWSVQDPPPLKDAEQSLSHHRVPLLMGMSSGSPPDDRSTELLPKLLVWSAADQDGLNRMASSYGAHVLKLAPGLEVEEASQYLENFSHTLARRRSSFDWKTFIVTRSLSDVTEEALKLSKAYKSIGQPKLGFVFTGQGAQYASMAKELLCYPIFQNSLRQSEIYMAEFGCHWSLIGELLKPHEVTNIDAPDYSQPVCTALQIALVDLLFSFGLVPSAVVGHSSGEIAGAYCIGALSHRSACKVAFFRGQCASKLKSSNKHRGAMVAVGLSEDAVRPYLETFPDLVIACVNSPDSVTVSGEVAEIDGLMSLLDQHAIFCRKLRVDIAYHSPQMLDIATDYLELLGSLEQRQIVHAETDIFMISTLTNRRITRNEIQQSGYWMENLVSQVKFSSAVRQLCPVSSKRPTNKLGAERATCHITDLLEVGPGASLRGPIEAILHAAGRASVNYSSVLRRKVPATDTLLEALGHLHCVGHAVNVSEANQIAQNRKGKQPLVLPDLPEYPFDHSREYWHESRLCKEGYRLRKHGSLDLLGTPVPDWSALDARWRGYLSLSRAPWIEEHKVSNPMTPKGIPADMIQVNGAIVYPAAGMLVMALEAAKQIVDADKQIAAYLITDVTFSSPLTVTTEAQGTETQVQLRPLADPSTKTSSYYNFHVSTCNSNVWTKTCRGTIQVVLEKSETQVDGGRESSARLHSYRRVFEDGMRKCSKSMDRKSIYDYMLSTGLGYGTSFQALQNVFYDDNGTACGYVNTLETTAPEVAAAAQAHVIHPTTLDGLFQLILMALSKSTDTHMPTFMPTRIGKLWVSGKGISNSSTTIINAHAEAGFTGRRKASGSMFALNAENNRILLSLEGTEMTTVTGNEGEMLNPSEKRRLAYKLSWKPDVDLLTASQVLAYCEELRPQRPSDAEFYTNLGFLMVKFLSEALNALPVGHTWNAGFHLHDYHSWAKRQVERFQRGQLPFLSKDHPEWKALNEDAHYADNLIAKSKATVQGKFFLKIAEELPSILIGETDPLAFMFEDDSIPEFYREVNRNVICYEPLERYLGLITHKSPGLKVLEIGAGTGATTDFILGALGAANHDGDGSTLHCTQYDYTDISPAFFEAAATRLKQHESQMRFKVLDIAEDPAAQGFEIGSYDLIIAASVLHATKNLEVTMRNTRALLKPGGKLVVFEVTEDVIRARFAFGLLPGWWLSEEEYRQTGPCISINAWDNLMRTTGFSGTDLNIPDYVDERCHEYTIMISTAVGEAIKEIPQTFAGEVPSSNACIIVDNGSVLKQEIANKLKDHLHTTASWACRIVALHQVVDLDNLNKTPCIFLIEMESALLADLGEKDLAALQCVLRECPGVLWITNGGGTLYSNPQLHLIDGLSRVARTEFSDLNLVTLAFEDFSSANAGSSDDYIDKVQQILNHQFSLSADAMESEYHQRNGRLEIARVTEAPKLNDTIHTKTQSYQREMLAFGEGPPLALHVESPGLLESLRFIECPPSPTLGPGQLQIEIRATGVNFLDCLTALGQIDSTKMGAECAGIVRKVGPQCELVPGDRVIALARDTYRSFTQASSKSVTKLPDGVGFAEGSALPVVFVTAWIALHDTAHLQSGESVLIHAGAGGTGQAAIQVAKILGAEVFVTVGSDEKKELLMKLYGIEEERILYSRDTTFAQGVMRMTGNRGVDVVLNSLSGEGLNASWDSLAPLGRFIEIGKRDIYNHGYLPMWNFRKNVTYSSVDLLTVMEERPSMISSALSKVLSLFEEGKIHLPQPFQVFGISEVEAVWRRLQSGNAAGKMAVEMRQSDLVATVLRTKPEYHFDTDKTYLIAGGLGGLGRSAAKWLASRGARYLILLSRSGATSETSVGLINELRIMGVQVEAPACDITELAALSATLSKCAETMPPVKGVIQASMVLQDAILENQTITSWHTSLAPKVQGTYNLHTTFPDLDFFITLSSIAGIIGSGGQANYAAGNTYMDALCRHRASSGQKSISLDLGWMADEGIVAETTSLQTRLGDASDMLPIVQAEFHALLDHYCNPNIHPRNDDVQVILGHETPAGMRAKGLKEPAWMQRRTFSKLRQIGLGHKNAATSCEGVHTDYGALLSAATSIEDAAKIVTEGVTQKLAKALRVEAESIDVKKPLHVYGVDSMLAVELRNWFAKICKANIAVFDIVGAGSFEEVGEKVVRCSEFCKELGNESSGKT
ncbi:MAG: hypothetical protein Q9226_001112 [Calogaya cf. arnoldii]